MTTADPGSQPVLGAIHARRSVRQFTDEPVPDEIVRALVDAARAAPSGGNRQMWRFHAIRRRETLDAMCRAVADRIASIRARVTSSRAQEQYDGYTSLFTHFGRSPCVVAVMAKPYDSIYTRIVEKYVPAEERPAQELVNVAAMSVAAAVENMLLAATALGYGACFMTGPLIAQREIEALLGVQEPWHVVALVPIGRPAAVPAAPARLALDEVLTFD